MSGSDILMIVVIVVLFGMSVFFAMAETSLTRMTKARAAALTDDGRRGAPTLERLIGRVERWLNPLLLIVLTIQIVQATLTGIVANRLFGPWGVAAAIFVDVVVVFVLAEAAPKTWAIQHTDRAALLSARPVAAIAAFPPLRLVSRGLIGLTNVILPGKGLKQGPFVSEEEILALADVAVEESVLDADQRQRIGQIIDFGDTVVREVMVPRPDMVAVPRELRVADVIEVTLLHGYSRLPVLGADADDVVGIVYAKDLMRAERDGAEDAEVGAHVRTPHFVPETKRVAQLLPEMQAQKFHMAIVVDEYGGTAGIVTLEDLIEELVGEIVDEFDREEPMIEPLPDGHARIDARMPVDEVNELLHARLPEGHWDTLGGLLLHLMGHVPHEGESVTCNGFLLRADKVQGRRIGKVTVGRVPPEDSTAGEDPAPDVPPDHDRDGVR